MIYLCNLSPGVFPPTLFLSGPNLPRCSFTLIFENWQLCILNLSDPVADTQAWIIEKSIHFNGGKFVVITGLYVPVLLTGEAYLKGIVVTAHDVKNVVNVRDASPCAEQGCCVILGDLLLEEIVGNRFQGSFEFVELHSGDDHWCHSSQI